jgi:uncharacterized protein (DUF169 family)
MTYGRLAKTGFQQRKPPIMTITANDWRILDKFKFEVLPVGIKYLAEPPRKTARLDKNLALCEMLKAGFAGSAFYADAGNHACDAGLYILGQKELGEPYVNGEFGAGLGVFRDRRAAGRLYRYIPRIPKGTLRYIALSPLPKLDFDPDILIVLATTGQAEILLRAMSYKTGNMWHSRYSSAIGCAWLFAYPYLNGEINFMATGLGFGMRRRKLFPEGRQFVSIPFDQLPSMLQTLREMPWVPRPYQSDGPEYVKRLRRKLGLN